MATMKEKKEKGYALGRSQEAVLERNKQLKEWENSDTNREQDTIKTNRLKPRVKFSDGIIFLAATAAGDTNEVEHLIAEDGIDVNYKNLDGMTALHQCCIDDNLEMAMILVKNNADINAQDKEGWTPLHAASSCGHSHIVQYLLNSGAYPVPVNSDGDTPRDTAEDDEVLELLQGAIESQGIDVDNQKQREEHVLLNDAIKAKNNPSYKPIVSPGGATLLHIAAAKGYDQVISVLLTTEGIDTDAVDDDGWTPLHAAVYWGNMDAAELLVEKGANVNASTLNGETVDDIVDPELAERLDELKTLSASFQKDQKFIGHHIRTPSFENMLFDSPKHNSPGLKRRLSKDRGDYPKLLDMLREKKELQQSMRDMQVQEEQTTSPPLEASVAKEQSPALTTTTATQPQKEQQVDSHQPPQHHEHSSSSEESELHQQLQIAQSLPLETVHSLEDKKMERDKRPSSVSERRKIFESSSSGSLDKKMAIQRREKTPGHSHSVDKDKNSNNSVHQHSTPLSHKISDSNVPKRFNFVSKPIMTVDDSRITTDSELKSIVTKRTSSAGHAKNVGNLQHRPLSFCSTSEYQDFQLTKTSPILHQDRPSLMAAAASASSKKQQQQDSVSVDSHDSVLPHSNPATVNHNDRFLQDTPVITTTASPTAASGGGNDPFSASFTSSGSEPIDSSMLSTERSMSFSRMYSSGGEEAEAKRRVTAKKKREARRVTQPVDDELWKQISREDAEEEKHEDKLQAEAEKLADELKLVDELKQSEKEKSSDDSTAAVTTEVATGNVIGPTHKPVQSRFKPAARPAPRIKADSLPVQQTLWLRPDGTTKTEADSDVTQPVTSTAEPVVTTSTTTSNTSLNLSALLPASNSTSPFSSPKPVPRQDSTISSTSEATTPGTPGEFSRARLQSDVRRRPKNTRRSTGITYEEDSGKAEEGKPAINDESNKLMSSTGGGGRKLPLTPDQQHNDNSRVVPPPPPPPEDTDNKVAELQRLLDDVNMRKDKIYDDYYHAAMRIDELKKHNTELTRRSEDTSRAYEQERKEKEKLQIRLKELEDMLKCYNDISSENQRLKDENGALIRVIGKLSRTPLQQQQH